MLQRIALFQPEQLIKSSLMLVSTVIVWLILFAPLSVAEDFPPTDGDMQGFVLVKDRPPVPDVTFLDGNGNVVAASDFNGKVLLLNFWATWCPPCIREMPALDRLQAEMGSDDFTVVAISADAGGKAVAGPFLRDKLGLTNLDLYLDPKFTAWQAFRAGGLPATFAIDRKGRIVGVLRGEAKWDGDDAKALIQHLLDESSDVSG